jgi:hypothetical protein
MFRSWAYLLPKRERAILGASCWDDGRRQRLAMKLADRLEFGNENELAEVKEIFGVGAHA